MNAAESFDGGCDCRQVRYRMTSTPLFVHCCHCRWCERETGSAFAINAMIESARVRLLAGDVVSSVRVGTLDDPDRFAPDIHIFTASKQPWVVIPPGARAVPEYYDREREWPPESLERRKAYLSLLPR